MRLGLVGHVLAEPGRDRRPAGRRRSTTRSKPEETVLRQALELVALDGQWEVRRSTRKAAWAMTVPSRPAMVAALALFVVFEVVGLLAAPLTALVLGRLPGAGLGFSKVFGMLLVTWLIWIAASLGIAPYSVGLIVGVLVLVGVAGLLVGAAAALAGGAGERVAAPAPEAARAAGGPGPAAAVLGRGDRLRRRLRARRAVRVLRARRLEHREADGHGVHHRDQRLRQLPAARPVDERRDAQLLLPRPPGVRLAAEAARDCARTRATCCSGAR